MEIKLTAFAGHRIQRMQTPRKLIEEIESHSPDSPILARNDDKKFTFSRSSSPMTVSPVPGVSSLFMSLMAIFFFLILSGIATSLPCCTDIYKILQIYNNIFIMFIGIPN